MKTLLKILILVLVTIACSSNNERNVAVTKKILSDFLGIIWGASKTEVRNKMIKRSGIEYDSSTLEISSKLKDKYRGLIPQNDVLFFKGGEFDNFSVKSWRFIFLEGKFYKVEIDYHYTESKLLMLSIDISNKYGKSIKPFNYLEETRWYLDIDSTGKAGKVITLGKIINLDLDNSNRFKPDSVVKLSYENIELYDELERIKDQRTFEEL